jgi:hypothetical protein
MYVSVGRSSLSSSFSLASCMDVSVAAVSWRDGDYARRGTDRGLSFRFARDGATRAPGFG